MQLRRQTVKLLCVCKREREDTQPAFWLLLQENQVAQEAQYKLKAAENGQSDHKAQLEELSLALG